MPQRKITIQCDNAYCDYSVQTISPLQLRDAGCRCPECNEVLLNLRDVLAYKALGVLAALRLVKFVDAPTAKSRQFNSRTGLK